jgi:hypothetical protein
MYGRMAYQGSKNNMAMGIHTVMGIGMAMDINSNSNNNRLIPQIIYNK